MGDLDLTEANDAAAMALFVSAEERVSLAAGVEPRAWESLRPMQKFSWREAAALAVTAAAPLIARQVREQERRRSMRFAEEIERYGRELSTVGDRNVVIIGEALVKAARIARGDS